MLKSGQNWHDLEILWMTLKDNRAPLLCFFQLCASFRTHWWIQTGGTVQKHPIWVKMNDFFEPCDLENWGMTSKNNRTPLLYYIKLCASFQSHEWIQSRVTVWKIRVKKSAIFCPVKPWKLPDDLEQGKSEGFESCDQPIVRKHPILVKIGDVLSCVTLKFDGWLGKTRQIWGIS